MTQTLQNNTALTPILQEQTNWLFMGYEMEIGSFPSNRMDCDKMRRILIDNNIRYCYVASDGSSNVDCEIIFLPMIMTLEEINKYIAPVQRLVEDNGGIIRNNCGGHIHVGLKPVLGNDLTIAQINEMQIAHWINKTNPELSGINGSYIASSIPMGETLPFELIKDVILTYAKNQSYISSMLPESRRLHRWAYPIAGFDNSILESESFTSARNIASFQERDLGKQRAINVNPFSRFGTLEFRQNASTCSPEKLARWTQFLNHLFRQSSAFRIDWNSQSNTTTRTIETATPESIGRNGSFINVMYDMCRNQNHGNGATIEELMGRFGRGAQNIRSRISEFRRELGHGAIVTHTQQANNHVYGDGEIYCRYQVLNWFNKTIIETSDLSLVSNPDYNIFLGMDIDLKNWIDQRINELR